MPLPITMRPKVLLVKPPALLTSTASSLFCFPLVLFFVGRAIFHSSADNFIKRSYFLNRLSICSNCQKSNKSNCRCQQLFFVSGRRKQKPVLKFKLGSFPSQKMSNSDWSQRHKKSLCVHVHSPKLFSPTGNTISKAGLFFNVL